MADSATQTMEIAASPERILETLLDFDAYPSWARDLKGVTVESRDESGRGEEVTFRAAAMGRSTSYTLRYDHSDDGSRLDWELLRGDIRSEEHTSELQSLMRTSYAVFCLKKKQKKTK